MSYLIGLRGIHYPVPQIFNKADLNCPQCNGETTKTGHIDTPPISLQMWDNNHFIRREGWMADRCYCHRCGLLFDVVRSEGEIKTAR
jgi:hypothetical protein